MIQLVKRYRLALAAVMLAFLCACEKPNHGPAIENVLLRDEAITSQIPAGTIDRTAFILSRMQSIDVSGTPEDFRSAWTSHATAWQSLAQARSAEDRQTASKQIKDTYQEVRRIAASHGARLSETPVAATPSYPPPTYALAVDCAARARGLLILSGDNVPAALKPVRTMLGNATQSALTLRDQRTPDQVEEEILGSLSSIAAAGHENMVSTLMRGCRQFADPAEISEAAAHYRALHASEAAGKSNGQ